ncbi:MAG: helix-turn-helix domain-containing protein [Thermodesulfobacteriota bacterium]
MNSPYFYNQSEVCPSVFVIDTGYSLPSFIEEHFPDLIKGSAADLERVLAKGKSRLIVLLLIGKRPHLGLETLRRIRRQSRDVAVVILSATHSLKCSETCANLSTQGYFVKPYDKVELSKKLASLILTKDGQHAKENEEQVRDPTVREALKYVFENCHRSISSKDVASFVCLSRNHFAEKCKRETGYTPSRHIKMARVEKAKRMILKNPSLKLGDVAQRSGFSDAYHFSKAFKHCMSQSPSEFKKSAYRRPANDQP